MNNIGLQLETNRNASKMLVEFKLYIDLKAIVNVYQSISNVINETIAYNSVKFLKQSEGFSILSPSEPFPKLCWSWL